MKKYLFMAACLVALSAEAQRIEVVDTDGNGISYATVLSPEAEHIGITDLDGVLADAKGAKAVTITHVAFKPKEVRLDGKDIRSLTVAEWCDIRTRHIAYLPQDMRLFGELTAIENVELKNRLTGFKNSKEILHLFEAMGIADKIDSLASKLSIGQQQRVAIIRTLCQPCDFILLDEPVSHLDDENNRIVADLIVQEADRQGAGVIATSVGNHLKMDGATIKNL